MLKIKYLPVALAATFSLFVTCKNKESEPKYTELAKAICECNQPLAAANERFEAAQKEGKIDDAEKILSEMEPLDDVFQRCLTKAEQQHGTIKGDAQEEKITAALKIQCPDMTKMQTDD